MNDYKIPYITKGHPHSTTGWINIHCPFCPGSMDYHLGIHQDGKGAHCWRCGSHSVVKIICKILKKTPGEARRLLAQYANLSTAKHKHIVEPTVSIYPFKFPQSTGNLNKIGAGYLRRRKFNPAKLKKKWGLRQTGPMSFLKEGDRTINYSNRILIPIKWNGEIVSFQTRDISERSDRKYLACPIKREKIHHKNILYGKQERWERAKALIIVEGVTDVWRLGHYSVATFGTAFKMEQVLELAKANDKFFIIFDDEPQAQKQARKLAVKLKTLGKKAYIKTVKGDPGGMKQEDANHLVRQLLGRR